MKQDIWNIIMWAVGASGVTGALMQWWNRWTKTRTEKKVDISNARIAEVQADEAELALGEKERESLIRARDWWLGEFNRVDKLLIDYKRESDARLETLSDELGKLKIAYNNTLAEKEMYKGLLAELVDLVLACKCNIGMEKYKQALQ